MTDVAPMEPSKGEAKIIMFISWVQIMTNKMYR